MAVSGNVKVCRLWDAHAEKSMQEIQIGAKNCAVTKLSLDNSGSNLLAVGIVFFCFVSVYGDVFSDIVNAFSFLHN